MKLSTLCSSAGLDYPQASADPEISDIVTDSRFCEKGCLYIAICGLHTDGHTYLAQAVQGGAACVLVERGREHEAPSSVCVLSATDTRRAAAFLYNAFCGDPASHLRIIGVTGTNGKTSVTYMLKGILEASLYRCGIIGTVGCESRGRKLSSASHNALANMTTPDPEVLYPMLAEMARDGVEYVLMEVTSHALALGKLAPLRFEVGIFTNLTPDHLDFHKSMDAYAQAKASFFSHCKAAIINLDSPYALQMQQAAKGRVVTCSPKGKSADYRVEQAAVSPQGVDFLLLSKRVHMRMSCPITGEFTVANAMQAAACALELGIGASTVQTALAAMNGVKGRMERVRSGLASDFEVIIDYAHTPDALEKLLLTARKLREQDGRLVLLFGCGGDRDKSKRAVMGEIAECYADEVILTSDNSRSEDPQNIIDDILQGFVHTAVTVIPSRAEAIRYAVMHARRGDILLLAGKGHEEYEIDRNGKRPFSEREIVLQALEERSREQDEGS